jgi:hypothetical protein
MSSRGNSIVGDPLSQAPLIKIKLGKKTNNLLRIPLAGFPGIC